MLVDTHCHLDFLENLEDVFGRCKASGVSKLISVGTSISASKKCIEIAEKFSDTALEIFASCGIHPHDGKVDLEKYGDEAFEKLAAVAKSSNKVVAIGECGLDFHLASDKEPGTSDQEKKFQIDLFEKQAKLAKDLDLPLIVHCRNGWKETFEILSNLNLRGVFHCWTGGLKEMKAALDLGFYISFSGIVTFKNAGEIVEVAKNIDLEHMLLETDSPFLSPEPLRGEKNSPERVKITAEFIASLRNLPPGQIFDVTCQNAKNLFGV